jgi:hypothetical protein
MNGLILGPNPPVKSVSLKKRYTVRGTRLVNLESLLTYIEAVANSQYKVSRYEKTETRKRGVH